MIKKILYTLATVISLAALAFSLIYSLTTPRGTNVAIKAFAKIVPNFSIGSVKGTFTSTINLNEIHYKNKSLNLDIKNLSIAWDLHALLKPKHKLHITKLKATDVFVKCLLKPQEKNKYAGLLKKTAQQRIKTFLRFDLQLDEVKINRLYLQTNTMAKPFLIDEIALQLNIEDHRIEKIKTQLCFADSKIEIQGQIGDEWKLTWHAHISNLKQLNSNFFGILNLDGSITGAQKNLKISLKLKGDRLSYADNSVAKIQAEFTLDLNTLDYSNIKINAKNLFLHKYKLDKLVLSGGFQRKPEQQKFTFNLLNPIAIETPFPNKMKRITIDSFTCQGIINERGLNTQSILKIAGLNPINISLSLPQYKNLRMPKISDAVLGNFSWCCADLSFLQRFTPDLQNLKGTLAIAVRLTGNIEKPNLTATVRIDDFHSDLSDLQLHLTDGKMLASLDDKTAHFQAELSSGNGKIKIVGKTELSKKGFPTNANISGKNFLISNTRDLRIISSPKLQLKFADNRLDISGNVFIPEAKIKQNNYSDIIVLPKEVEYVTRKKTADRLLSQLNTHARLKVIFGDNVKIDIMDLQGRLTGELKINDMPGSTLATGVLNIKNGTFNVYGQSLNLTKSHLYFANSPITNPKIEIEATRSLQTTGTIPSWQNYERNLIVGIRMQGQLDKPKITLFSLPSILSDADIFSYLIIGQPSNMANQDKLQLLLRAAQTLNFSGYDHLNKITMQLRKKLGLSRFGLESQMTLQAKPIILKPTDLPQKQIGSSIENNAFSTTTALVLGKYLSPRLYIGYNYRIFDQVNIFKINYRVSKFWIIESESSTLSSSVDFIYQIEKD